MDHWNSYAGIWYATSMKRAKTKCSKATRISLKDLEASREPWADKYKREMDIPYVEFYKNRFYVRCNVCREVITKGDHAYISNDGEKFLCEECFPSIKMAEFHYQKID